ncbi:glycerophosphodiester phosphodiesterase family protein [Hyphomicrobium sp.]|uniref:glycerophosphodiester phosphodiesterase family protein n=1 Tax=Hyphomicrobium sp. TaxID=82 RepID=UPI002E3641C3|nr:glycerophosphodiester phosphodiesterase family protein [Hyphomicrobium sp.]HEX2843210.1 glycerophosphodiester phosphodiesterase family protein [Hyphomicrobium sp.]
MKRFLLRAAVVALAISIGLYLANTSLLGPAMTGKPTLLAHRGLAQTFPSEGVENDTCTASRMRPPEHPYLENTIASMHAAFAAGADIVEFDVHPTTDGKFAVFHDWTIDCRTNGKGVTREKSLAELKALDIGYGYTADGGKTYPFRGTGVGLMPSLDEVLTAFPDKRFLVHVKSRDAEEGKKLAARLSELPEGDRARLMVYGDDTPLAALRETLPEVRMMGRGTFLRCLTRYIGLGWSSYVPADCRGTMLLVPANYAGILWGWPNRFLSRMRAAGTDVFLIGPYTGGEFTTGIDTATDVGLLPGGYDGGIWTNRIHAIAPLVAGRD